jgi:hypothetical protein
MAIGASLHIGLNRVDPAHYQDGDGKPWEGRLTACEFDAKDMQALAEARGFATQLLLTEQATSENVIASITKAAQDLQGGDILLLTYSGHGGQVPDLNGEEEDELDETWCLYDRELVDDELYALWAKFKPGVRILMLSDSCHSGSVARDPAVAQIAAETGNQPRVLPLDVQSATYKAHKSLYAGLQASNPSADKVEIGASVILISGCQDNQLSYDGHDNSRFTGTLLKVWRGGKFKGDIVRFTRSVVSRMPIYQSPSLFRVGTPNPGFEKQRPFTI